MALSLKPIEIVLTNKHPLLVIAPWWGRINLSEIASVQNGFAFKSTFFNRDVGLPLIRIRDINKLETENLYSGEYNEDFIVNKNDILIGMDGDFNCSLWKGKSGLLNQRVCRIKIKTKEFSKKFLFLCLQPYLNAINEETSSVTVKHLSSRTIQEIPLPLPSLKEQHRIVNKIESLFSKLDKGTESLKTAREQLKLYRQALLKHAFEGKLTAQWRTENADKLESAETLLARIKEERENRYQQQLQDWEKAVKQWEAKGKEGKKPSRPAKIKEIEEITEEESENLFDLPCEWGWQRFGEIYAESVLGKMLDKQKNKGKYLPYLRNINVRWGRFNLDSVLEMRFEESELERYSIYEDDLVICEGGEPGRCSIWKEKDSQFLIQKALHRVRLLKNITHPEFILHFIQFSANQGLLNKYFTGTTIKHLTGTSLSKLPIPLCEYSEQQEIIKHLNKSLSYCDMIEKDLAINLKKSQALRQSILKKAFSGKLVPQDPNDEPASELLKRIAAEKAQQAEKAKQVRKKASVKKTQSRLKSI